MKHRVGRVEKPQLVDAGPRLPQFVHDFLGGGAPEGSRNETLHRCAQQYFWARLPIEEAKRDLLPAAMRCGLKEGEATQAILSGYRSGPGEPIRTNAPAPALRPVSPGDDFLRGLRAAFNAGELIAISDAKFDTESGKWRPDRAVIKTREEWEDHHKRLPVHKYITGEGGGYIAINPLVSKEGGRRNTNVAAYRHVLAEFDGGSLDEQRAKLEASGFPISVIVTSGKRSVHGWIRVDAKDKQEWETRRDHIFRTLECDPKNKDLARVSRCPGVDRVVEGKKCRQELLATNIGPRRWIGVDDLPPIENIDTFLRTAPKRPQAIVEKLLYPELKMILAGPSKARKSYTLLDLCLCVSHGIPWMGMETHAGRVLYINFELKKWMAAERLSKLRKARGLEGASSPVDLWNLRGHAAPFDILIPRMMQELLSMKEPYRLIVVDPFYSGLGDREENVAEDISALMNELERFALQSQAAIVIAHHFGKGDPWDKLPAERMSGSGVFFRAPDALFILTGGRKSLNAKDKREGVVPDSDLDTLFFVDIILRHDRIKPFRVRWMGEFFEPERSGIMTYRLGSKAENYGPILEMMPRLTRTCGRDGEKKDACELMQWIARECKVSPDEAFRIFDNLRKGDRYDFIQCEGDGVWVGKKFCEHRPF